MRFNLIVCVLASLFGLSSFAASDGSALNINVRSMGETVDGVFYQPMSPNDAVVMQPYSEIVIKEEPHTSRRSILRIELRRKAIRYSLEQVNPEWKGLASASGELQSLSNCVFKSEISNRLSAVQIHGQQKGNWYGSDRSICVVTAFFDKSRTQEIFTVLNHEAQAKTLLQARFPRLTLRTYNKSTIQFPAQDIVRPLYSYLHGQDYKTPFVSESEAWFSLGVAAARSPSTDNVLGSLNRDEITKVLSQLMPVFFANSEHGGKQIQMVDEKDVKEISVERITLGEGKTYEF